MPMVSEHKCATYIIKLALIFSSMEVLTIGKIASSEKEIFAVLGQKILSKESKSYYKLNPLFPSIKNILIRVEKFLATGKFHLLFAQNIQMGKHLDGFFNCFIGPQSDQWVGQLMSRNLFRSQDQSNRFMSYFDVIF